MKKEVSAKYPKILIISNNSLSDTNNNGKTLASFFDKYPTENIAQLYFNPELPKSPQFNNFFRITDFDVVKSIIMKCNNCGGKIYEQELVEQTLNPKSSNSFFTTLKNYNFARITREIFWKQNKWKTESLENWLEEFSPEVIFFCAGDSVFAYDITHFIKEKYNSRLVVYITDDYVLPRKIISPFWWLRRNWVLNNMKKTVHQSDLFITISEQMKEVYKELFGVDSFLAVNMTESMKDNVIKVKDKEEITLVYAGGLHYKRFETLTLLAQSLKKYNDSFLNNKRAVLKIYSGQEPSRAVKNKLNIEGTSEFCGKLNAAELKVVLNSCDIPVHVESFDHRSIESTRLSISTKIPEYLSLGKPILAIGPNQVASMKYLKDSAFCITNQESIYPGLKKLFNSRELCDELSKQSFLKYEENHNKERVVGKFIQNLVALYEGKPIK